MDLLKKIRSMTTSVGIYQHGRLNEPDPKFGYALEDQARALIVADELKDENLKEIYLNFIMKAKREDGLLYHFYYENDNRDFNIDKKGLFKNEEYNLKQNIKEAYGITLWSLLSAGSNSNKNIMEIIKNLTEDAHNWTSPRAISTALLGLLNLDSQCSLEKELKVKLHNYYFETRSDDWEWFENYLVYANAIIPWALWEIYIKRKCKISFEIAKKTTEFLLSNCQENNIPSPIGNRGWYTRGKSKALFDQQPIDSGYMVCCLEKAYRATKDNFYLSWAEKWYKWFWANNINKTPLIDENFACYDALTPGGVNLNQGAESNICFLMAYLAVKRLGMDLGNS
ncbi:MAG: glycoside hydrolase family 76 protein [Actinobacteria bacterium]|nr:glycoside hydrolase family 76 protein [Actinomycetota bacterium]